MSALLNTIRDLIQQDIGNRGLARDAHENLFTACRGDFEAACRSIAENAHAALAIVTGFPIFPDGTGVSPVGETDGPLGALFLARALSPLGIAITLVTDAFCRQALEVGLETCGLRESVFVTTLPPSRAITHLLALERVGPGRDGRCRNMRGLDVTDKTSPLHTLFDEAARQIPPLATIGIGDGGNEIGMGKISPDVIARNIPNGALIACRVPVDHLIVAGVSNWGAYALAVGVAILRGQCLTASLFDIERERDLLRIMVERGPLVDGVTARPTVTVDGLSFEDYAQPLRRLGEWMGHANG